MGDPRTSLVGRWHYNYDDTGQLTGWTAPDGRHVEYTYDPLGNRLNVRDNGVDTAYSVNNLNQYTKVGSTTYQYDADGNLKAKLEPTGTTAYDWSFDNKLVQVTAPSTNWQNGYDAKGNLTHVADGSTAKNYVIDPAGFGNVVGEYLQGATNAQAVFVHSGGLVSRSGQYGSGYYTFDAIGSTSELLDNSGSVSDSYSYLPFGELLYQSDLQPNNFQFIGEAGIMAIYQKMNYMRARHYYPQIGRFISIDPIGLSSSDINFYRYGFNEPISHIDPTGLESLKECVDNCIRAHNIPYVCAAIWWVCKAYPSSPACAAASTACGVYSAGVIAGCLAGCSLPLSLIHISEPTRPY